MIYVFKVLQVFENKGHCPHVSENTGIMVIQSRFCTGKDAFYRSGDRLISYEQALVSGLEHFSFTCNTRNFHRRWRFLEGIVHSGSRLRLRSWLLRSAHPNTLLAQDSYSSPIPPHSKFNSPFSTSDSFHVIYVLKVLQVFENKWQCSHVPKNKWAMMVQSRFCTGNHAFAPSGSHLICYEQALVSGP